LKKIISQILFPILSARIVRRPFSGLSVTCYKVGNDSYVARLVVQTVPYADKLGAVLSVTDKQKNITSVARWLLLWILSAKRNL